MEKIKKIFIVPYCHPDWAWTFTRKWHEKRYILVFEEVFDILRKHPEFRWYFDTYITQLEPFIRCKPERYKELKKRIKGGKIDICGTFTNLRPNMTGEETQIRDIIIGREMFKKLFPGTNLYVYAGIVDVSVGHPQIPQILCLSGYKYLRFMRPHGALSLKKVPLEFFWEGVDGSKILCSRGHYYGLWSSTLSEEIFINELKRDEDLSLTGIRWISQGADDCRPLRTPYEDKIIPIFEFMKKWNKEKDIPLEFATPTEFFNELEKYKDKIPTIKGSLDPCEVSYNVGFGGKHGLFYLRQENEINLIKTENYATIATIFSYKIPTDITTLWEKHLLTCAHATQWLFEEDFKEVYNIALSVKLECEKIKNDAIKYITKSLKVKKGTEFVIFNTLPYERVEKIFLTLTFPEGISENFSLTDGKNLNIPFQIKEKNERANKVWEYQILAKLKLPPVGFNTISVIKGKPQQIDIKKLYFEVKFEDSYLTKIEIEQENYKSIKENSFGDLKLYKVDTTKGILHVGPITSIKNVKWSKLEIKEDGELYRRYQRDGNIENHEIKQDIIVYKDEPMIEFQTTVDWRKEDGFLTFEFPKLFNGKIYGDISFGVEEKNIEEPYEPSPTGSWDNAERARKGLLFAKTFVNYTDGIKSISYLNYDATHYYILLEKSIGNILLNSFAYKPGWERFINEEMKALGQHTFISYLIFHFGDWKKINLPQKSQCLFIKPEKIYPDRVSNTGLNSFRSFISISPDNLIMTALYREGKYFILRFYETEGRKTNAKIKFLFNVKEIKKIDLQNKTLISLTPGKNISLEVKPYEIVTIKFF